MFASTACCCQNWLCVPRPGDDDELAASQFDSEYDSAHSLFREMLQSKKMVSDFNTGDLLFKLFRVLDDCDIYNDYDFDNYAHPDLRIQ